MRWLELIAVLGATAFGVWRMTRVRLEPGTQSRKLAQLAAAVLALVWLAAAVYAAHLLGLFSIPLVAVAFVPIGAVVRWSLLASRESRRRESGRTATAGPRAGLVLPMLLILVAMVAVLGVVLGTIIGAH